MGFSAEFTFCTDSGFRTISILLFWHSVLMCFTILARCPRTTLTAHHGRANRYQDRGHPRVSVSEDHAAMENPELSAEKRMRN